MLTPLTAVSTVTLANERATIQSIYAHGGRLLVGLSTGSLQVYQMSDPFSPSLTCQLNAVYKDISSHAIDEIGVIQDAGILVILSNGIVSVYDLDTFTLEENLNKTKGATVMAVAQGIQELESGDHVTVSRLMVGCKRRLVCYEWRDSEFAEYKEISMAETIKSLCFQSNIDKVVCGLQSEFCVVDITSSSTITVTPETHASSSFAASVGISYIGIGARQPAPHCVSLDVSVPIGQESDPCQPKTLLVRDIRSQCIDGNGHIVDSYPQIEWSAAPTILAFSYPYLICALPSSIEVRNPETATVLQTLPISNVKAVNDGKLLFVATQHEVFRLLLSNFEPLLESMAETNLNEAISLLGQIEPVLIKDKENMLRRLQIMRAQELFDQKEYEQAMLMFSEISAPPDVVLGLFPESWLSVTTLSRSSTDGTEASLDERDRTTSIHTVSDLDKATRYLLPYLADTRRKISKLAVSKERVKFHGFELSEVIYGDLDEAATLVDTTLFKCYMVRSQSLVGPLVRVHNHCDPIVVKDILTSAKKWKELIDFYFGKGMHREALLLLKQLGEKNDSSELTSPEPTVKYLQRLTNDNFDLIAEFSIWPITQNISYGRDIFLEDSPESEGLSRSKVFRLLFSLPSKALCVEYLEHLINDLADDTSLFHNNLATLYIGEIQVGEGEEASQTLQKLLEFLVSSTHYRVDRILSQVPADDSRFFEVRAILNGKLGEHRKALELYAFDMGDSVKARKYCSELFANDKSLGQTALHTLLSLYWESMDNSRDYNSEVLELLSSQGSRMSPIEVISRLPSETKLSDISQFLQSQVRSLAGETATKSVEGALLKVHLIRTQEQLLQLGQRHSVITNHRTCKVCMKRLGHSVISVFPDDVVVHYGCAKLYQGKLDREKSLKAVSAQAHRRLE